MIVVIIIIIIIVIFIIIIVVVVIIIIVNYDVIYDEQCDNQSLMSRFSRKL